MPGHCCPVSNLLANPGFQFKIFSVHFVYVFASYSPESLHLSEGYIMNTFP